MESRWPDRVKSEEALCTIKDDRNIIRKIRRLNGLVTSCVGSAFENTLLKGWKVRTLQKRKCTGISERTR